MLLKEKLRVSLFWREILFNAIIVRPAAVDDKKFVPVVEHQQRVMPKIAAIIYALLALGEKCVKVVRPNMIRNTRDDYQIRRVLKGYKSLRAKGMAFHHVDLDWFGRIKASPATTKYTDYRAAAIARDINVRQIIISLSRAVINHQPFSVLDFNDVAKGRKGIFV